MKEQQAVTLLEQHGIRPTANRIVVVEALASSQRPLSLSELENTILTIDKSGIFRALSLFKEHHLVHIIEGGSDGVHYEICHSNHDEDDDQHVHFYCNHCHRTFCIDNIAVPVVELPDGYQMASINYMVKGICPECK